MDCYQICVIIFSWTAEATGFLSVAIVLVFSWGRQNWFLTIESIVVLVVVPSKLQYFQVKN
jgi:hypothetical protein